MVRKNSQVDVKSPILVHQEGLSYIKNVGSNPLVYRTIGQELGLAAKEYGDQEAFVFIEENRRFTYKQLLREADQLAAGFQNLGAKIGDCVAFLVPNVPTWPILVFAAARAGLISVTLNPTYSAAEIKACLKKISAKILVTSEKFGHECYYDKILEIIPEMKSNSEAYQSKKLPNLSAVIIDSNKYFPGTLRLKDVMRIPTISQINNIKNQQGIISPDSGCNIQFTSGFTGSPKAVLLSHFGLINTGYHMRRLELGCARFCMAVPVCHLVAYGLITMASLCNRGTVVVPSSMFNPEKALLGFFHEKCNVTVMMPKMLMGLVSKQKELKLDIKNLIAITGGDVCSPKLFEEIRHILKMELKMAFGMTEYCGFSFTSLPGDSDELKLTSDGFILDHMEVKVVDDDGNLVPFGTPGELYVRGYCTMIGYMGDEEKTREVLESDGWFKTGDYFILYANGYGKVLGRIKEIIRKGKEKIFPKEIENTLATCPRIAEVYVVGVPDEDWGEEVCAFVRLHDENDTISPKDIYEFCKGRIQSSWIPRYVQIVSDFPKTISGKVKKLELKNLFKN